MAILISVIEEDGNLIKEIGLLEDSEVIALSKVAKQMNLKCLPFIDPASDTYFNELQSHQILREIKFLREKNASIKGLNHIEEGAQLVSKGLLLLKFQGE